MTWKLFLTTFIWAVSAWLPSVAEAQESYVRIESVWKPNHQINIETGSPIASETQPTWWSADWVLEPAGRDQVRIKNRWKGTYLHLETGRLTAGPIEPGWLSAMWVMENAGQGLTRFQNAWKGTYLNIESGTLTAGPIQPGWNSAMWRVKGGGTGVDQVSKAAATVGGVAADSSAGQAILASRGRQCVKAIFGIGYAAKVRWYASQVVNYDPVTKALTLREGAQPEKEETIDVAIKNTSCIENKKMMFAQVSVIGGEFANEAITIATGTAVAIASGVAGAVACIGTVGSGCPAAAAAVGATVSGVVSSVALALPEAKETFYLGSPGKLEIWGTVWSPKRTEVREYGEGKPVAAACSSDTECGNNTCAYGTAKKNAAAVCCASGSKTLYGGYNYCTGMPAGSTCWSDYMCASGACTDNMGGLQRGTCK